MLYLSSRHYESCTGCVPTNRDNIQYLSTVLSLVSFGPLRSSKKPAVCGLQNKKKTFACQMLLGFMLVMSNRT